MNTNQVHRRPYAVGAEDIGTWFTFLDIMSTIAVVSNMALFVFTGSQLSDWGWVSRIAFFSVMEHVLLSIKFLIALAIPDVPEDVEDQQAREKFLCSKVRGTLYTLATAPPLSTPPFTATRRRRHRDSPAATAAAATTTTTTTTPATPGQLRGVSAPGPLTAPL